MDVALDPVDYERQAQLYGLQADAAATQLLRAGMGAQEAAMQWEYIAGLRRSALGSAAMAQLLRRRQYPLAQVHNWGLRLRLYVPLGEVRADPDRCGQWLPPRRIIACPVGARRPGWHRLAVRMVPCVHLEGRPGSSHAVVVGHRRTRRGLELRLDWRRPCTRVCA